MALLPTSAEEIVKRPGIHVVPILRKKKRWWSVRRTGSLKGRTFLDSADAYEHGKGVAQRDRAVLYVHDEGGRISARQSFVPESLAKGNAE